MSLSSAFMRLMKSLPDRPVPRSDNLNSFETQQRDRFAMASAMGLIITLIATLVDLFLSGIFQAWPRLLISVPVCSLFMLCIWAANRVPNIELYCRIWIGTCALALWLDIFLSGGIKAPNAPMLLLLPIGAGVLLRPKDIFVVTFASCCAIALMGYASLQFAGLNEHMAIVTDTIMLMLSTLAAGLTIIMLVVHHQKINKTRHRLLLAKEYVAQHDGLTGLVNRATIGEQLAMLRPGHDCVNAFLADLDGFKEINDAYGHQIGDEVLSRVAARLRECAPIGATVARLGGDEFLILAKADKNGHTIGWTDGGCPGVSVVEQLSRPFKIGVLELHMSGSVGIAHFPSDAQSGEELLSRADLALYAAKTAGRDQCATFAPHMEVEQNRHLALQNRLRIAVERGDIFLNYQPQFCLKTNTLTGFEALARWKDDLLGLVGPDKFIAVAEDCGIINDLGEHVLTRACKDALSWPAVENGARQMGLSVNISTLQLNTNDIVPRIRRILEKTGFPPDRLELEITESVLITDPETVMVTLNELAAMGISIAMDDFGKGYSSLSYLQNFSLTRLKIDRSFIANLDQPNGPSIVRAIIQLAEAMELSVVAEGVEIEAQRFMLAQMGCHFAQGYLYAPGLSPSDTLRMIIEQSARMGHEKPEKRHEPFVGMRRARR